MVRWSGLILPILVIIGFILGLVALGFGGNYAINLVQKSRLAARIQIQENLINQYRTDVDYRNTRIEEYLSLLTKSQQDLLRARYLLDEATNGLKNQKDLYKTVSNELNQIKSQLNDEKSQVNSLTQDVNRSATSLKKFSSLQGMLPSLNQDRLLLIELRKDLPDTRDTAGLYLNQLKELGVKSDPSLGPKVDRINRLLPTYFDWYEKEYPTLGEAMEEYINSGAVDFDTAYRDFEKDALHVVIKRIDALIYQLD